MTNDSKGDGGRDDKAALIGLFQLAVIS